MMEEQIESVCALLRRSVPRDCVASVSDELKKDFVFAKKRARRRKEQRRARARYISRSERRALGFYHFSRTSIRYEDVTPMNSIWTDYMTRLLDLDERSPPGPADRGWEAFTQSIYRADLHGAVMRVVRSRCPSYVGKTGICVMDTRCTFKLVSEDDTLTTVPKKESVFELRLRTWRLLLFGKHLCVRPAERSVKKIKCQQLPDL